MDLRTSGEIPLSNSSELMLKAKPVGVSVETSLQTCMFVLSYKFYVDLVIVSFSHISYFIFFTKCNSQLDTDVCMVDKLSCTI